MANIRAYAAADWPQLWPILQNNNAGGDTFPFAPETGEFDMHHAWVELPTATFVACDPNGALLGSYYIKPNQPGLGAHVCNAGYVVAEAARGRGIATAMCEDSQRQALARGFRAMQFNFVVATNAPAVTLWQHLGFAVIGTVPAGFRHRTLGFVDALIMFKTLV